MYAEKVKVSANSTNTAVINAICLPTGGGVTAKSCVLEGTAFETGSIDICNPFALLLFSHPVVADRANVASSMNRNMRMKPVIQKMAYQESSSEVQYLVAPPSRQARRMHQFLIFVCLTRRGATSYSLRSYDRNGPQLCHASRFLLELFGRLTLPVELMYRAVVAK